MATHKKSKRIKNLSEAVAKLKKDLGSATPSCFTPNIGQSGTDGGQVMTTPEEPKL